MTKTKINILKNAVHTVPDYPKEGILFRDVTGLLDDATAFSLTIELLSERYKDKGFTKLLAQKQGGFYLVRRWH